MSKKNRTHVLSEADRLVNGDRNVDYGDPISDFRTTAEMWSAYLSRRLGSPVSLEPHDVAAMMMCLKISRISWVPDKEDNWVDLAGYAACGWDCVLEENSGAEDISSRISPYKVGVVPHKGYYWGHEQDSQEAATHSRQVDGRNQV